jgi:hypothetical protein
VQYPLSARVPAFGGLLSVLLIAGLCAVPVGPAAASSVSRSAAKVNSQWLARQLGPDGTLQDPLGGVLPDHGLMIDALYAMYASGDGELAEPVVSYLEQHADDFFTWDGLVPGQGFENIIVGGATTKLLVAAEVAGRDPRNFGGHDMVAETKGTITRSGPDRGRVSDYAKTPDMADFVSNNANMFGQALGVIGLAGVGENDQLAIDRLLTQQCSEGYFRIFFGYIPTDEVGDHVTPNGHKVSSCDEGKAFGQSSSDGDATGLALSAMLAARKAGAPNLDEPISRAVAWLKANQAEGGGWGGGVGTEAPNTNSTGLIVQALDEAGGADTQVAKGLDYLLSAQATKADTNTALGDHVGAIAYNPESYQAARTGGIIGIDTWIRAGAQASLGLSRVGFHDLTRGAIPTDSEPPPSGGQNPPPPGVKRPPASPPVSGKVGTPAPPPGSPGGQRVVTPPASQAQPASGTPAGRLGRYLAGMLVDGDHVEVTEGGRTYTDYESTADVVLALRTLGEQPEAAARASRFLLHPASVAAYAHGVPYEKSPAAYAEPLAKLRIVAGFLDQADEHVRKSVSVLDEDLAGLRGQNGRFADMGAFGDADDSIRRHSWAILATTAGSRSADDDDVVEALVENQCADGTFPARLGAGSCASGDLVATAAAVEALNGVRQLPRPQTASIRDPRGAVGPGVPPKNVAPPNWSPARADALVRAAVALTEATDAAGLVHDRRNTVDVVVSAESAAGRQAVGLDVSGTTRALATLLRADGGLAKPGGGRGDLATSARSAPGIAGRSWTSAERSPVAPAVRLPLVAADHGTEVPAPAAQEGRTGFSTWQLIGLVGLGSLLATAVGFCLRRTHGKNKGVSIT